MAEAESLAGRGIKELILIAQDTTLYGKDLYGKYCLAELLRRLVQIDRDPLDPGCTIATRIGSLMN